MDWQRFLFDPEQHWISRLERLAQRRFYQRELADQAFEQALGQLQADNWKKLNQFAGRSSPATFLVCVYRHLLEDFAVARFGKCRAPVWVQQLGALWQTVYKRLCCERQELNLVAERLARDDLTVDAVRQIGKTIKAKIPDCGAQIRFESLSAAGAENIERDFEDEQTLPADAQLIEVEHQRVLQSLQQLLSAQNTPAMLTLPEMLPSQLGAQLRDGIDSETLLLIKMVFQDDLSVAKAALILNWPEHTARRRIKHCLSHWRQILSKAGFGETGC